MKKYAIMRTRKLKTDGNVGASLSHAWRDRETPNADQSKTPRNIHMISNNRNEALARYRKLLPEKVRKNGIRCIEYLITYSPKALKTPEERAKYFQAAIDWLSKKHGKNLFYAGIHMDEKTPHLYAYAVPNDGRGKLNCRAFLGGREKLSALQDEFYEQAGRTVGLDRGIKGSRVKHQTLKQYYGQLTSIDKAIQPPKKRALEKERDYTERYKAQVRPLVAAAAEAKQIKQKNEYLEKVIDKAKKRLNVLDFLTEGLTTSQIEDLAKTAEKMRSHSDEKGPRMHLQSKRDDSYSR